MARKTIKILELEIEQLKSTLESKRITLKDKNLEIESLKSDVEIYKNRSEDAQDYINQLNRQVEKVHFAVKLIFETSHALPSKDEIIHQQVGNPSRSYKRFIPKDDSTSRAIHWTLCKLKKIVEGDFS